MLFLTGTENQIIEANAQINQNCGLPNNKGTNTWGEPTKMYLVDLWYIPAPPENGWNEFSYEEMMYGVVDVSIQESQPSWFPPAPPPV